MQSHQPLVSNFNKKRELYVSNRHFIFLHLFSNEYSSKNLKRLDGAHIVTDRDAEWFPKVVDFLIEKLFTPNLEDDDLNKYGHHQHGFAFWFHFFPKLFGAISLVMKS